MADILYTYKNGVYLNITNKCPCRCTFCIRSMGDGLGSAKSLWLKGDPTLEEIIASINAFDFTDYQEIIFCGYGEPTCALDNMIAVCDHIRATQPKLKIRLNTNGLSDLINKKPTAKLICDHIDSISISLNASNAEAYNEVTRPSFGPVAFDAMIAFSKECKQYMNEIKLSVVDTISPEEIEASKAVAAELGIPLRVRNYGE